MQERKKISVFVFFFSFVKGRREGVFGSFRFFLLFFCALNAFCRMNWTADNKEDCSSNFFRNKNNGTRWSHAAAAAALDGYCGACLLGVKNESC